MKPPILLIEVIENAQIKRNRRSKGECEMRTYDVVMTPSDDGHWVLKSEAERELRHHKYKRCLAMVEVLEHIIPMTNRKLRWQDKWHKRWLKLADKFKEAK